MFECSVYMLEELFNFIPYLIGLYLAFDFIGSLLFNKRGF